MISLKQNLKQNKTKQNRLTDTENKQVLPRGKGGGDVGEIGEGE